MNQLYEQLFNMQYINALQQRQHDMEQRIEIKNAVNALHDFFNATRKISPEYRQMAGNVFGAVIWEEVMKG